MNTLLWDVLFNMGGARPPVTQSGAQTFIWENKNAKDGGELTAFSTGKHLEKWIMPLKSSGKFEAGCLLTLLMIQDPVNRPHITSLQASSPSSVRPSAGGSCWVLCSVGNGRDVTLSWYRGNERLNQTSSLDLSTSLSLPLEVWEDSPAYSCVATNPVSEESAEGNIRQLCPELGPSPMPRMYIIPAIPAVLIPTAVMLIIGLSCLIFNTKKFKLKIKAPEGPLNSTLSVGVYIPAPLNPRCSLTQHSGCTRAAAARDGDRKGQTLSRTWDSLLTAVTYTEGKYQRDVC